MATMSDPGVTEPDPGVVEPLDRLLELLDLEQIEENLFRGVSPRERAMRVFGGQVAAQALVAATRTVTEAAVHSLHAYFLRPGDPNRPIVYDVDRIRDGRSYSTRRVVGIQAGQAIFNLQASFHRGDELGYEHQIPAPEGIPEPESLESTYRGLRTSQAFLELVRPIEIRAVPDRDRLSRYIWMRANGTLGDDPTLHCCVAAYASDLSLLPTALLAHPSPEPEPTMIASLDHAMWFHRPFRADEWMLYEQISSTANDGRAFCRGQLWRRDGTLAMTVAQEGVLRH
jgi:acyl-CoA thioesterase II